MTRTALQDRLRLGVLFLDGAMGTQLIEAGDGFRTMMGVSPTQAAEQLADSGITALGFNCGTLDMDGYTQLASEYASALDGSGVLLQAEPNAGRPELEGDKAVYTLSADAYADGLQQIKDTGAMILGRCCGTTPNLLAAAVKKIS